MRRRTKDMSGGVCPRCLYIRPEGVKDCACTYRMAALERALREFDSDHEALSANEQLAATKPDGSLVRQGWVV